MSFQVFGNLKSHSTGQYHSTTMLNLHFIKATTTVPEKGLFLKHSSLKLGGENSGHS